MAWEWLGGVANAASSLINGLFSRKNTKDTNKTNVDIADKTNNMSWQVARANNAAQLAAMRENNAFNRQQAIDMFNLEAEYNSPSAQKQRLIEAGLNPATMYGGSLQAASGNVNASTPSASSSGITPSMPSFVTPQIQTPPTVLGAMFEGLESLSRTFANVQNAKLSKAQKERTQTLVGQELQNLISDMKNKEVDTALKNLQLSFDKIYGAAERNQSLKKTVNESWKLYQDGLLSAIKGDTEKSQQLLNDAEKCLKSLNADVVQAELPFVAKRADEAIKLIQEQQKTERSQQANNYAIARYNREQASQLEDMHQDILFLKKQEAIGSYYKSEEIRSKVRLLNESFKDQLNKIRNEGILSGEKVNAIEQEIIKLEKANSWYEFNQILGAIRGSLKAGAEDLLLLKMLGS